MEKKAQVSFKIQPFEGTLSVTPVVDGTPLPEIVAAFEREQHFEPAGGYGGLIPEWFKYGALDKYLLGDCETNSHFCPYEPCLPVGLPVRRGWVLAVDSTHQSRA